MTKSSSHLNNTQKRKSSPPSFDQTSPSFRPPMLNLNPAFSSSSLSSLSSVSHSSSGTPKSPFASVAAAAAGGLPMPTPLSLSHSSSNDRADSGSLRSGERQKKTNIQRAARATREFRDVWIVE